jgi:Flp pilus assembly protein TadD
MWIRPLRGLLAGALLALLAGCQPSAENRQLLPGGMTAEDAQFYPSDNYIRTAKVSFKNGDYGSAALNYQQAVQAAPKDTEAWLGLAASYDQLRRFDLADQAYQHVMVLGKDNPAVLNNAGYSEMLRGNYTSARRFLLRAQQLDPQNPYIQNNLALLNDSERNIKRQPDPPTSG